MGELVVPETDDHACPAAHSGMHGAVSEEEAKGRVMWFCRHAPDGIAGIDVFGAYSHAGPFEVFLDCVSEEGSDVTVLEIPGSVTVRRLFQEVLARPSRHYDHRVAPQFKPPLQFWEESLEGERNFGNTTKTCLAVHQ